MGHNNVVCGCCTLHERDPFANVGVTDVAAFASHLPRHGRGSSKHEPTNERGNPDPYLVHKSEQSEERRYCAKSPLRPQSVELSDVSKKIATHDSQYKSGSPVNAVAT